MCVDVYLPDPVDGGTVYHRGNQKDFKDKETRHLVEEISKRIKSE